MRVGNFSLVIPEGFEQETGHVLVVHGTQYSIRFMSHVSTRADVELSIDGKTLGTFRLQPYGRSELETIPNDGGRFTFYADASAEAAAAGIATVENRDRGLIQARFIPERPRPPIRKTMVPTSFGSPLRSMSAGGKSMSEKTSGGITGMSGHSNQEFVGVGPIDRDEAHAVTISIRLVAHKDGPRPLRANPYQANPVPNPVG